jgi:hypothetical protein
VLVLVVVDDLGAAPANVSLDGNLSVLNLPKDTVAEAIHIDIVADSVK